MAGVDLFTVKEVLGHKTIEMTMRYAHLSPDHKIRAVEVLADQYGDQPTGTKTGTSEKQLTEAEKPGSLNI